MAKLRVWASVAGRGRLLLSCSVAHASLKTAVDGNGNLRHLNLRHIEIHVFKFWLFGQ